MRRVATWEGKKLARVDVEEGPSPAVMGTNIARNIIYMHADVIMKPTILCAI